MRSTVAVVVVVVLVGCRSETEIQKCDRLRAAATTAVTAYVDARQPEEKRLDAAVKSLDAFYRTTLEIRDRLRDTRTAIACGDLVGVATRAQPERASLDEIFLRGEPAVDGTRLCFGDAHPVSSSPDPATIVPGANEAAAALQAALRGWGPTINEAPSRPGKPWSAKQRAYLASLEKAWCDLDKLITPVIETHLAVQKERRDKLEAELEPTRKQHDAYVDASTPGHDVASELRAGLREVRIHPSLHDDPAFAPSEAAIESYNRCRD